MPNHLFSRREILGAASLAFTAAAKAAPKPIVSVVQIKNDKVDYAVEKAIDLLGGMKRITKGVNTVMLKPNLVSPQPTATTKPAVIRTLARLMKKAGKEVSIGEGSAASPKFNVVGAEVFRTRRRDLLDPMQQYVFEQLGYAELAKDLHAPLVNLHSGELIEVPVPNGFVFDKVSLNKSLAEVDLLCSVPMMKTHQLATVTLGMKNLIGTFPGTVYQSVRGSVHDKGSKIEPTGASAVVVDMVRANNLGLTVIDGSMAMEGNGPSQGEVFKMDVIVAGTNPVAADLVASAIMGFEAKEIPTFAWAAKAGLRPETLEEVIVRGDPIESVRRPFKKPFVVPWKMAGAFWGAREM
mgnify:CR=1 FL=1